MITIQYPIVDDSGLSLAGRQVLGWIPGGTRWFQQAISDGRHYTFHAESALLNSVLQGLYSAQQVPLSACGFSASADFLLGLNDNQRSVIDTVMQGGKSAAQRQALDALIDTKGLVTEQDYAAVQERLAAWSVAASAPFQHLNGNDLRSLHQLETHLHANTYSDALINNAVAFAKTHCANAGGFAKLVQFALRTFAALVSDPATSGISPMVKTAFAQIFDHSCCMVMQRLVCPTLAPPQTTADSQSLLRDWGRRRQFTGFTDLPTGVLQLVQNIGVSPLRQQSTATVAMTQLEQRLWPFLADVTVSSCCLSQDGTTWRVGAMQQQTSAEYLLNDDGCLTLDALSLSPTSENS
ncbi:hypothetical protein LJ739_01900 [Aestuariibacter halophilus]|uniref:Uncharacterized protein n=1 Tax=Fluctibacter halophilus TaxID=226011 RepID=A0ABS8G3D5_9ALTE|nr:hypothetical protein [Aestuariibacter halophilus]MCC2614993.1 hypothetical protein [Aestuariibacter halophilus]